jgi:hypothetical protein
VQRVQAYTPNQNPNPNCLIAHPLQRYGSGPVLPFGITCVSGSASVAAATAAAGSAAETDITAELAEENRQGMSIWLAAMALAAVGVYASGMASGVLGKLRLGGTGTGGPGARAEYSTVELGDESGRLNA